MQKHSSICFLIIDCKVWGLTNLTYYCYWYKCHHMHKSWSHLPCPHVNCMNNCSTQVANNSVLIWSKLKKLLQFVGATDLARTFLCIPFPIFTCVNALIFIHVKSNIYSVSRIFVHLLLDLWMSKWLILLWFCKVYQYRIFQNNSWHFWLVTDCFCIRQGSDALNKVRFVSRAHFATPWQGWGIMQSLMAEEVLHISSTNLCWYIHLWK